MQTQYDRGPWTAESIIRYGSIIRHRWEYLNKTGVTCFKIAVLLWKYN